MKCSQCPTLALYRVGPATGTPLCLDCYSKLEHITFVKFLHNAAMLNQANDDMDAVVGFGFNQKGRIPVAEIARAMSRSTQYNNINITNSNVGVINTGNLARIDAAITISKGTENEEFGARLKDLTEAILGSEEASNEAKQKMIEVAKAISDQAIASKSPSATVIGALFGTLAGLSNDFTLIAGAVEKLHQVWISMS